MNRRRCKYHAAFFLEITEHRRSGREKSGEPRIIGVMIESNLVAGRQDVLPGTALTYGQSITDGCIDWQTTVPALELLAEAVGARRQIKPREFRKFRPGAAMGRDRGIRDS